jgi:hypothetical protein
MIMGPQPDMVLGASWVDEKWYALGIQEWLTMIKICETPQALDFDPYTCLDGVITPR